MEHSTDGIVMLDLKIFTDCNYNIGTIQTSKACDSHAYLMPTSCHPAHICKNIPSGVMKRIKRNFGQSWWEVGWSKLYIIWRRSLIT